MIYVAVHFIQVIREGQYSDRDHSGMLVAVVYLWIILYVVRGDDDYCTSDYKYANDINKEINITQSCNDNLPCIAKCCPVNQILVYNEPELSFSCLDGANVTRSYNFTQLNDYSDVVFYDNDVKKRISESTSKLQNFTIIYNDVFLLNYVCSMDIEEAFPKPTHKVFILESGVAVIRRPNYLTQWYLDISPGYFCIEYQIDLKADGKILKPKLVMRMRLGGKEENFDKSILTASAMLVSCVFLLLVLVVYALLKELRNLAGLMMMTYVSSLTAAFLTRALQFLLIKYASIPKATCVWIGLLSHYTVVASFTWMNVMSFDIWWSMRGFRKMRQIHRRGILVKFGWYSLYGWGAPLLLILFMIIVENQNLTHMPDFVKPNYMNEKGSIEEQELLLYLYCPILITTCINIMLFLMTAYNIWRIKQGVTQHNAGNSRRNKKDETRYVFH
ncbi:probable G-protein coupled receptor Mth-like 3 isoform X2 [Cydia pomonella]|uniref:probable G-protein coupled receptor Mth-like 3 isoform X2 n=1 Tax=Cydia pomonella TaxID=82600 RepID=UPI002ADD3EDA|nr:probable G-protein coupled receptor Mth-like 3 isoform X2 [Cydia pomonella]